MGEVVTYKPECYCQIKLNSGDRILISITQSGIKIITLTCMGLVPGNLIAKWELSDLGSATAVFADPHCPTEHLLDAIKAKLLHCQSITEVREVCQQ